MSNEELCFASTLRIVSELERELADANAEILRLKVALQAKDKEIVHYCQELKITKGFEVEDEYKILRLKAALQAKDKEMKLIDSTKEVRNGNF